MSIEQKQFYDMLKEDPELNHEQVKPMVEQADECIHGGHKLHVSFNIMNVI